MNKLLAGIVLGLVSIGFFIYTVSNLKHGTLDGTFNIVIAIIGAILTFAALVLLAFGMDEKA